MIHSEEMQIICTQRIKKKRRSSTTALPTLFPDYRRLTIENFSGRREKCGNI